MIIIFCPLFLVVGIKSCLNGNRVYFPCKRIAILLTGTETAEYLTMVECTTQITTLFKHDLSSISDYLWAQGMMSEDIRGELLEPSLTRSFKATLLVNTLTERIRNLPGDYHKFVEIVKMLGPWARDMAEHLDQIYTKNCKGNIFKIQKHFQNVMLVRMASEVSKTTHTSVWIVQDTTESRLPRLNVHLSAHI